MSRSKIIRRLEALEARVQASVTRPATTHLSEAEGAELRALVAYASHVGVVAMTENELERLGFLSMCSDYKSLFPDGGMFPCSLQAYPPWRHRDGQRDDVALHPPSSCAYPTCRVCPHMKRAVEEFGWAGELFVFSPGV